VDLLILISMLKASKVTAVNRCNSVAIVARRDYRQPRIAPKVEAGWLAGNYTCSIKSPVGISDSDWRRYGRYYNTGRW
jgi:hypothetical protein